MSDSLGDIVGRLARIVGVVPGDLRDGHARWQIYQQAMDLPAARGLLLQAVSAEDDGSLASTVVLRLIEGLEEHERAAWVRSLRGERRSYAHGRLLELATLELVLSGGMDVDEVARNIEGWTDWLQLRIAESVTSPGVLGVVGETGRTRRIRNIATGRQARLGK